MKGIIYVPYANGSCVTGFKYDKPLTSKQYVKMETDEYNDHKDGVMHMMYERYGNNMAINNYNKRNFKYQQQSYNFHNCECVILNIEGQKMMYSELEESARSGEQFIIIVNMNEKQLKNDPDLETDLKMWFEESLKVKNCKRLSDVEVMYHLPKKDFKLKIVDNNANVVLKDCKFLNFMSAAYINSFAIIVNKINFIKE